MRYLSVCSGIDAASVAWGSLGWQAVAFSEIEPFPCAVLAHHYPDVPNLGDMTTIAQRILNGEVEAPDVFAGGTPCQSFSVAGLRKSLADERGNLTLKFVEIADAIDSIRVRDGRPQQSSSGKTSPASSAPKTTHSAAFWERLPAKIANSSRQGSDGRTLVVCLVPKEQSRGGSLMPNISAWPNAAAVCSLSQVLEKGSIPQRYFLSSKACEGILRRAEKRGKQLPPSLRAALEAVALERTSTATAD